MGPQDENSPSPTHSGALRAGSGRTAWEAEVWAAGRSRSRSSVWTPPPPRPPLLFKISLQENKTCLRSTLWSFLFPHICVQISNLTGVALYQLGNPAFFVNTTVHSESFPTTGSFAAVSPSPGKGAGSESGRGGVSLAGRKWVRTGSGRGGDGWVWHPGAQIGLVMGSPGTGGEERAGLQRERLGGTMEPGASDVGGIDVGGMQPLPCPGLVHGVGQSREGVALIHLIHATVSGGQAAWAQVT